MDETTNTIASSRLHRRTVVKGAAWTVPAITLLGSTQAMAASSLVGVGVAVSGKNLTFTFTTSGAKPGDIVRITAFSAGFDTSDKLPLQATITNNGATITVHATTTASGGANSYTVTFFVTDLGSQSKSFQY